MPDVVDFKKRVEIAFKLLEGKPANSFPAPSALSSALERLAPLSENPPAILVKPEIAALFTTAAVEMWMRSIHSFLISAALAETSPIWASVAGYYSSHYSVRAYAHLLGYFQLFAKKKIVHLVVDKSNKFNCNFMKKDQYGREHEFYWRIVKKEEPFKSSVLFTRNERSTVDGESDCRHREKANYADHLLSTFPRFNPLTDCSLKGRLERLSKFDPSVPQIPRAVKFPDLDRVQLVAYQRLVHFRRTVDDNVSSSNRFWKFHRSPQQVKDWIDFQLPELGSALSQLGGQS